MPKHHRRDPSSFEFRIFIICENIKCFQRAARLKEKIVQASGNERMVTINFCCVDWLYSPTIGADATRRATKANIILFLGETSSAFPKRFADWLKILPWSVSRGVYGIVANPPAVSVIDIGDSYAWPEGTLIAQDGRISLPEEIACEIFGGKTRSHETPALGRFKVPAISSNN